MHLLKKVKYKGWNCNLYKSYYEHGKRVAIYLIDADGEPVSTCTVNIDEPLRENEVFIKDYSENEGMVEFLVKEGVIELTGREILSGYVSIPVCKLLL